MEKFREGDVVWEPRNYNTLSMVVCHEGVVMPFGRIKITFKHPGCTLMGDTYPVAERWIKKRGLKEILHEFRTGENTEDS